MKPIFREDKGLSEKVADYIKERIQTGYYSEESRIPGERDMALSLDVSRNTVREAYKILEAYGYLKAYHGKGIFITSELDQIEKMTDSFFVSNNQIQDLYAIRLILEEAVVEWAVKNGSAEEIDNLSSIVEEAQAIVESEKSSVEIAEYDLQFHLYLAKMSKNAVANRIMHHLIDLLAKARSETIQIPKRAEQSVKDHLAIVNAIQKRDIEGAKKAMRQHLESVDKSIKDNKLDD